MRDLIERQKAIDVIVNWAESHHENPDGDDCIMIILDVPSAQPEIIRCKDCRWRKDQSGSTAWLPCRAIVTPSDFYCGRAERRTDG